MSFKIFEGANGYYIAWENADGFHRQPFGQGAEIGWDAVRARKALRAAVSSEDSRTECAEGSSRWSVSEEQNHE